MDACNDGNTGARTHRPREGSVKNRMSEFLVFSGEQEDRRRMIAEQFL